MVPEIERARLTAEGGGSILGRAWRAAREGAVFRGDARREVVGGGRGPHAREKVKLWTCVSIWRVRKSNGALAS